MPRAAQLQERAGSGSAQSRGQNINDFINQNVAAQNAKRSLRRVLNGINSLAEQYDVPKSEVDRLKRQYGID